MLAVTLIDTSVLCNIVPVPGRDQDRDAVLLELRGRANRSEQFVLPITAIIETGNFIAQLTRGHDRRSAALALHAILSLICRGESPWLLHDVPWGRHFLTDFLRGAGTGLSYPEHAVNRLGAGDLCILIERAHLASRVRQPVHIWSLDSGLTAFA